MPAGIRAPLSVSGPSETAHSKGSNNIEVKVVSSGMK